MAILVAAVALSGPSPARAQTLDVGDFRQEYLRVLQLLGQDQPVSFTVLPMRTSDLEARLGTSGRPWSARFSGAGSEATSRALAIADSRLRLYVNSDVPMGQNDGAVWQGRGLTAALDFGARGRWRGLSVAVRPTLIYTQNADFELAPVTVSGMPEYAYPWRRIDLPQRFGPDPFWKLDPGQSEIRVRGFGAAAAFGTTNLWWGPAVRNAIVMSNNAAGFPHVSLGTDGPLDVGIGLLEAQWIWGDLEDSDWYDPARGDPDRFLTGIVLGYSPSFLRGLTVGMTRTFYAWKPAEGIPLSDYFLVFQGVRKERLATPQNPAGNDEHDQILSLFGRWVPGGSGFEAYVEWARNDHSWNFTDLLLEPEHSQAYTLGLQQALELSGNRLLVLKGEITHLERPTTIQVRISPTYYAHHIVGQGYTHGGQVLGAGIGPGGNSQHVGADLYAPWGRAGLYVQRDVRDNDAYYGWVEDTGVVDGNLYHHVPIHLGLHGLGFAGDLTLGGGLAVTREFNRYFFGREGWNANISLTASWQP
jgi:hypothetical protein